MLVPSWRRNLHIWRRSDGADKTRVVQTFGGPERSTRPSGRTVASKWYIRGIVKLLSIEIREPTDWEGSYNSADRFGSLARPKPATPFWAPSMIIKAASGGSSTM